MKLKLSLISSSLILLTACANTPPPIVNMDTFSGQTKFQFDDTLKRTVLKGPEVNIPKSTLSYSIMIDKFDDNQMKVKFTDRYEAREVKNIFKVVDVTGKKYNIAKEARSVEECRNSFLLIKGAKCNVVESGIISIIDNKNYKLISVDGNIADLNLNEDYLNSMLLKKHKIDNVKHIKKHKTNSKKYKKLNPIKNDHKHHKHHKHHKAKMVQPVKTNSKKLNPIENNHKHHKVKMVKPVKTYEKVEKTAIKITEIETVKLTKVVKPTHAKPAAEKRAAKIVNARDLKKLGYIQ